MIKCIKCNMENDDNAKFCKGCGANLEVNDTSDNKAAQPGPVVNFFATLFAALIVGLLAYWGYYFVFSFAGKQIDKYITETEQRIEEDLVVTDDYVTTSGGADYIEGTVTNISDRDYTNVWIHINLYNGEGEIVSTTSDFISNIEASGTWHFKTSAIDKTASTYKINGITAY